MTAAAKTPVVLVHGTCVPAVHWKGWTARYSARGHSVITLAAPLAPGSDDCLRPQLSVDAAAVADYYERLLQSIAEPPILIGHCVGGVVTESLLNRGLGAVGVALNTPPLPEHRPGRFETARQLIRLSRPTSRPASPAKASRSRAPLLLVGSGMDDNVPAALIEVAAGLGPEGAVTSYLEYPDACHHLVHTPGWQRISDDVLDWATLYARPGRLTRADV